MKRKRLDQMINLINDEYINEANPKITKKESFAKRYIWRNIAACLVVVLLATNIVTLIPLFQRNTPNTNGYDNNLPPIGGEDNTGGDENGDGTGNGNSNGTVGDLPPSSLPPINEGGEGDSTLDKEENTDENIIELLPAPLPSEYDSLIGKLNSSNAFSDGMFDEVLKEEIQDSLEDVNSPLEDSNYVEVTDNQVNGVIEGDLFKRTETHLFYLQNTSLVIYKINGLTSTMVGSISLLDEVNKMKRQSYQNDIEHTENDKFVDIGEEEALSYLEMYLSWDGSTVTVIIDADGLDLFEGTVVTYIDVRNPAKPTVLTTKAISGKYITSRVIDDRLVVFTNYRAKKDKNNYNHLYIPMINMGKGFEYIPANRIWVPEKITSASYGVVTMLDQNTMKVEDAYAYLNATEEPFVTKDKIYLRVQSKAYGTSLCIEKSVTTLVILSHSASGIVYNCQVEVDGEIRNRYFIDEYNGVLRVVTTLREEEYEHFDYDLDRIGVERTNAALYCFDLATMEKICEIKNFAPDGEEVMSVRFDKNYAYVCTAIVVKMTDPVFFIDLTDMNNPKISETEIIDGYSSSLVSLGDGYLLGIGFGKNTSTMKLEIYKEIDGVVVSVASYESARTFFSSDYKAYCIDKENKIIALGVTESYSQKYVILRYDETVSDIALVARYNIIGSYNLKRGFIKDEYIYILSPNGLYVRQIFFESK